MLDIIALAEVPDCWAISSAWSVFGICYLIVAVGIIAAQGGLKGGATLLNFALVGAFLVSISGPGENPDYMPETSGLSAYVVCEADDGSFYWGDYLRTVRQDPGYGSKFNNKYNTFDPDDHACCDPEPKVYAMHCPEYSGYISPKIFHPAAFFWSPFLAGIFGFVAEFLWGIFGLFFFSSY